MSVPNCSCTAIDDPAAASTAAVVLPGVLQLPRVLCVGIRVLDVVSTSPGATTITYHEESWLTLTEMLRVKGQVL